MVAERARMALRELAAMIKVEGKGRGLLHDRRSRLEQLQEVEHHGRG